MSELRVISNIQWNKKADRGSFKNSLKKELDKYSHQKRNTSHEKSVDGAPKSIIDVVPEASSDADSIYSFIKDKIDKIPAVTGTVNKHDCPHALVSKTFQASDNIVLWGDSCGKAWYNRFH